MEYYAPARDVDANKIEVRREVRRPRARAAGFGLKEGKFGFTVTGSSEITVVVEGCFDLGNPVWTPVSTNVLSGGASYFADAEWSKHSSAVYRFRSP